MTAQIKPTKCCGALPMVDKRVIGRFCYEYSVFCMKCGERGDWASTELGAILKWGRQ